MSVLLTTLAALPSAIWECHDKHDFRTKDPRIKDQDLRFVGASIDDCQQACNASAANCSVISWHGGDLHCHIWQGSGLITHDDFMANISDACGHTTCIVSESALPPSPPPPPPTYVTTPSGRLRGFLDPAHEGLRAFRGIPYAKPPVGDLRWRPPRPFGTWEGTRDATQFGHTCIQQVGFAWETVEGVPTSSEDCLYLNVVAPAAAASAGVEDRAYPVVVYLHAGQFQYGAGSDCESDWPFADDIVYVTPNSRLGPFGFLGSDELRARAANGETGSYGLSDQRLALQWVRENSPPAARSNPRTVRSGWAPRAAAAHTHRPPRRRSRRLRRRPEQRGHHGRVVGWHERRAAGFKSRLPCLRAAPHLPPCTL
jgi:hypothetical protein